MKFINVKYIFGNKIDYERLTGDCMALGGSTPPSGETILALIALQLLERIETLEQAKAVK